MDNIIYNAIAGYYDTLCKTGYFAYKDVYRILLLCFYYDFIFNDYRRLLSRKDYHEIERALNCLFGSNCLIPYPDYLKMGKLHLGEITEMVHRLNTLEETEVLKEFVAGTTEDSDVIIVSDED